MQLHERIRPATFEQIVGQDKAVSLCRGLIAAGLGGRAVWIQGQSGTGKTTLAKILAESIAAPLCCEELDATDLTPARVKDIERESQYRGLGGNGGRAFIVNESHGLRRDTVRQLLVVLERIPAHVVWIFTTTNDGQAALFEGTEDAHPLLSRCLPVSLARQGLAKPFAAYLRSVDPAGPGDPKRYVRIMEDCRNNLRAAIQRVESDFLAGYAQTMEMVGAA